MLFLEGRRDLRLLGGKLPSKCRLSPLQERCDPCPPAHRQRVCTVSKVSIVPS